MTASCASRELAKGSDDDGTIPLPASPVVRHHTASLNVLPPRATRAAEAGSNPEGGPTGKLAEDAAGPAAAGFLGYPFEPILCFL